MSTQLTDSLGATWTYLPEYDQWETEEEMNETEWEGCDGGSTLDMDDFIDYAIEDLKAEFLSRAQELPWMVARPADPTDLPRLCAQLREQLLALRNAN